jgi:hypothetical protein
LVVTKPGIRRQNITDFMDNDGKMNFALYFERESESESEIKFIKNDKELIQVRLRIKEGDARGKTTIVHLRTLPKKGNLKRQRREAQLALSLSV